MQKADSKQHAKPIAVRHDYFLDLSGQNPLLFQNIMGGLSPVNLEDILNMFTVVRNTCQCVPWISRD